MTITITHTDADGTSIDGTSKGDGTAPIVKAHGFRWSRNAGLWYIPSSRNRAPRRDTIGNVEAALRAAGHDVEVNIDATPQDRAEADAAYTARNIARAEGLTMKAEREQALSDARYAAYERTSSAIPLGQPILVGHHSERRHRRDLERMRANVTAAAEHQRAADTARAAARSAAAAGDHRHNPVTVGNRIRRLTADAATYRRNRDTYAARATETAYPDDTRQKFARCAAEMEERLAAAEADLAYWQQVRDEQLASGVAGDYGPHNVKKGDLVKVGGAWHVVARANRKTVAVETGYSWTNRCEWHKVTGHRTVSEESSAV